MDASGSIAAIWYAAHATHGAPGWFCEDLAVCQFWQLLFDQRGIIGIGDHDHVLWIYQWQNAVIAHLQQGASRAEEVDELFGHACAAIWPETAANAAAHYHAISVGIDHCVVVFSVVSDECAAWRLSGATVMTRSSA